MEAPSEHFLYLRVILGNGIADDNQIRVVENVFFSVTVAHFDALLIQEMTHGRINFLIGTGNLVTKITQHTGKRPHTGAAHGNQMNRLHRFGNFIFIHSHRY